MFLYGNGDLVGFDLEGRKLWARNLQKDHGKFSMAFTYSSSPTLLDGRVYIQVLQKDSPYLLAFDPKTGKLLFKHSRPSEAKGESRSAYSTPIPFVAQDGHEEILLVGGDALTGHHPATGEELWRWETWNTAHRQQQWRLYY